MIPMNEVKNKANNKTHKKGQVKIMSNVILVVIIIGIMIYFVRTHLQEPMNTAKEKYSSSEYGDFGDADGDTILNIQDNCPAKACDPNLNAWDDTTLEKNPSSNLYGCTAGQERCGTSMDCRRQESC
jgi:hypothetical protein